MINIAATVVLKAVWGQGHGRERSWGMDDRVSAVELTLGSWVYQLGNCPREAVVVNANLGAPLGIEQGESCDRSAA